MISFLQIYKSNAQIYIIYLLWLVVGVYGGPLVYLLIPATIFLLFRTEKFTEILVGLTFILILSDSLEWQMAWAGSFKPIYLLFMSLLFFLQLKSFQTRSIIFKQYVPYFILLVICLAFAPSTTVVTGIQKTVSYILLFLVVPNIAIKAYEQKGPRFFKEYLAFSLLIFIASIILKYTMPEVGVSHGNRLRGVFGNPNGLGLFLLATTCMFVMAKSIFSNLFSRGEYAFFILITVYIAYATGSRNALMTVLILLLISRLFKFSQWAGILIVCVFALSYNFLLDIVLNFVESAGLGKELRVDNIEEGSGRFLAWGFAWLNIQDSFFLGRGLGFDENLMRENFWWLSRKGHEGGVHNTYLIVWLNTGIIGLVFFLRGLFLVFIKGAKKSHISIPILLAVLLSITFEPWLGASLNPYTSMLLITITALTCPIIYHEEEQEEITA